MHMCKGVGEFRVVVSGGEIVLKMAPVLAKNSPGRAAKGYGGSVQVDLLR